MITEVESKTEHFEKLVNILEINYLMTKVESPFDFIYLANMGVNVRVINKFRNYFSLSKSITARMFNVSEPTIYRWIKANKNLERNFSVKLFEVTDLFLYGSEVFGSKESFLKWLDLPNTALGGMEPKQLVEIPGGVSKIKDVLGRIEHGVYS